jgi:hypothetical protein
LNIQGQYAELNGTLAVEQVETTQPGNTTAFLLAKGALEAIIQSGQNLRLFNQQIVPPGNPAIPGLNKYAAAEEVEKALAAGLTGDYAVDKAALDSLKKDITQGIQLNTDNLKNVSRDVEKRNVPLQLLTREISQATSECAFYVQFPPANEHGV